MLAIFVLSTISLLSIFEKIFKRKKAGETEEEKEEIGEEEVSEERVMPRVERPAMNEKEEKELIKAELKPGPLTEKFFEISSVREKKKEKEE